MRTRPLLGLALLAGTAAAASAQTPPLFPDGRPDLPVRLGRPAGLGTYAGGTAQDIPPPRPVTPPADKKPTTPGDKKPATPPTPPDKAPATLPPMQPAPPVVPPTAAAAGLTPADLGIGVPCNACDCDPACGPSGRVWTNFQWLMWAASGQPMPALATGAPVGIARPLAGTLGSPTTDVLFGGQRVNNDLRNGFRITGGMWLNPQQTFGVEADFFFLEQSRDRFAAAGNGAPIVSRPFFNPLTGLQDVQLVSFPGVLAGRLLATAESNVAGAGLNAVHNLCCDPCGRVDLLYGYRYLGLHDSVRVTEDLTALAGDGRVPPGFRFQISDRFSTRNNFHGGLVGLSAERRFGRLFAGVRASVALGGVQQIVDVAGTTLVIPPTGLPAAFNGGLLAQTTNSGHFERNRFAVLPEIGARVGVQVTEHARAYVGYNFIYLSNVVRAGDQIDPRVNPTLLPPTAGVTGPLVPAFNFKTTDYWLQGITLGVEFRF